MKSDKRRRNYPEAENLYKKGFSVEDIGIYYGRTRQAMWQWMKARNIKMRPREKFGVGNHFYRGGPKASDRAQNLLEKALMRGIVHKNANCEICGCRGMFRDGRSAIQAHHADYNKPLEVMWLCQKCHHAWHKKYKPIERR
jgi:hypothetical protein